MWFAYVIAGLFICLFIVTIPFGLASFRIASYAPWPFGRTLVSRPSAGAPSFIGNVIWFSLAGIRLPSGTWLPCYCSWSRSSASRWRWPTSSSSRSCWHR